MKPFFLLIAIAAVTLNVYGQPSWEHRRDSLLTALSLEKADSDKIWTMLDLGILYLENQNDSADYYAKALSKLSEKNHVQIGRAHV